MTRDELISEKNEINDSELGKDLSKYSSNQINTTTYFKKIIILPNGFKAARHLSVAEGGSIMRQYILYIHDIRFQFYFIKPINDSIFEYIISKNENVTNDQFNKILFDIENHTMLKDAQYEFDIFDKIVSSIKIFK